MENRKLVSWRLEKLEKNQQDTINAWLDAQPNIQLSLTNIVQHMIDRFGITDIMNYDVQKALYTNPDAIAVSQPKKNEITANNEEKEASSSLEPNDKQTDASQQNKEPDLYDDLAGNL